MVSYNNFLINISSKGNNMQAQLSQQDAQKLNILDDINGMFRLPDSAYIHGNQVELMQQLDCSLYFSNYWYGPKVQALEFAEKLAQYFAEQYRKVPYSEDRYDFYGMVMFWDNGDNAMVGNINVEESLSFWNDNELPGNLKKPATLKRILDDGNDNDETTIAQEVLTPQEKQEMLQLLLPHTHENYLHAYDGYEE